MVARFDRGLIQPPRSTVLDPACGDGALLQAVLEAKTFGTGDEVLGALAALYGIDVEPEYAESARRRLAEYANSLLARLVEPAVLPAWRAAARRILGHNISTGDSLTGLGQDGLPLRWRRWTIDSSTRGALEVRGDHSRIDDVWRSATGEPFDLIIANPPWDQRLRGTSAAAVYPRFVERAIAAEPHFVSMVTPSRWLSGGRRLERFRASMLNDHCIVALTHVPVTREAFPGLRVEGGVCFWLRHRDRRDRNAGLVYSEVLSGQWVVDNEIVRPWRRDVFVGGAQVEGVLAQVEAREGGRLGRDLPALQPLVSSQAPFGLATNAEGRTDPFYGAVPVYRRGGIQYLARDQIPKRHEWIDRPKVYLPRAYGDTRNDGQRRVIGRPVVAAEPSVCTQTYLVVGPVVDIEEADSLASYLSTRFARFLIALRKPSQDLKPATFAWVPRLPLDRIWTDDLLAERYDLTPAMRAVIERSVRAMLPPTDEPPRSWRVMAPLAFEEPGP